jgi:hypothetical protein
VSTSTPGGSAVLSMTVSLDGFISDREGSVARLYPDLGGLADSEDVGDEPIALGRVEATRPPTATGIRFRIPA